MMPPKVRTPLDTDSVTEYEMHYLDRGVPESKTYNIVTDHMPVGFGN